MGQVSQSQSYGLRSIEGNLKEIYRTFGPDLSNVKSEHALKSYKEVEKRYVANGGDLEALKKSFEPKVIRFSEAKEKEVDAFLKKEKEKWAAEDKVNPPSELTKLHRERVELNLGYPKHLVTRKDESHQAYAERRSKLDEVNKTISELEKKDPELLSAQRELTQKFADMRTHAREVQNNADRANGIVRSSSGSDNLTALQRENDRKIEFMDNVHEIWKEARNRGYGSSSGTVDTAVARSSYSNNSNGPALIPGKGLDFQPGEAARMNRDYVAGMISNTSGRAAFFANQVASIEAKKLAEEQRNIAHRAQIREEYAIKAERSAAIISEHLSNDPSGESLAEVKNLHYIAKNGDLVSGSAKNVMKRMEQDFPDQYEGITENLTILQKKKVELAVTEKKTNFLLARGGTPGAINNKEFLELKRELDKINVSLEKHEKYLEETDPRKQRKHELSNREKNELTSICKKYGLPATEDGVMQVASIINTRLGIPKPVDPNEKRLVPEIKQASTMLSPGMIELVQASNKEASSVSPDILAKAGANLSSLLSDAFKDLIMPPAPSIPTLLNAGQYQTTSISAPSQAIDVKMENAKLYAAHSLAVEKS